MLFEIISFFSSLFTHTIFVLGVVGAIAAFTLGFLPFVSKYAEPLKIISIILILWGSFLEGSLYTKNQYKAQIDELNQQVEKLKNDSKKVNTKVVTKLVTQQKIIKQKGDDVIKYIDREVTKDDNKCVIPQSVIIAHNAAALGIPTEDLSNKEEKLPAK